MQPAEKFDPQPSPEELALGTEPIPAKPYYCPAYFALEREAIFKRQWLQIGHDCEIPESGDFIVREIDICKTSVLITRTTSGAVKAFHNVCTHRGTRLVDSDGGRAKTFTCPYHAWTFQNDGQLRAAPDFERFYVDKNDCNLTNIHVDVCAGLIFVNLNPDNKESLQDFLGDLSEELENLPVAKATHFSEYVYEIDANWKLAYDNFQENYHLRFIHPRSGEATSGKENPFGYPLKYRLRGKHRTQTIWFNSSFSPKPLQALAMGKAVHYALQSGFANAETAREYYALFPNFFTLGSPTQPFSHMVMPISENRSRGVIRIYWIGEDQCASQRFAREYMTATALDLHSEDRGVIEAGQRGLESGALKHIHFQSQEVLCRHLYVSVEQSIRDYQRENNQ